jgi:putative transposase
MLDDLTVLSQSNPDSRKLERATAVTIYLQGYKHREIQDGLFVSSGFISKWTQLYQQPGASGLRLRHQGSVGYLDESEQQSVIRWLQSQAAWNLLELQNYLQDEYDVVFSSKQSYYALFHKARISWKKTQKRNPNADPSASGGRY